MVAAAVLAAGCTTEDDESLVRSVEIIESPDAPLAVEVVVTTVEAAVASVTVTDDEGASWTVEGNLSDADRETRLRVYGLRPEVSYEFEVLATGEGVQETATVEHTAAPLPEDFPALSATGQAGDDGWTLFPVTGWTDTTGLRPDWGWLVAVDARGRVVWWRRADVPSAVHVTADGTLAVIEDDLVLTQYDWFGTEVAAFDSAQMPDADTLHHESIPTEDGGFYSMVTELRRIDGYPDLENPGMTVTEPVIGDEVVKLDADGNVTARWSLIDLLPDAHFRLSPLFFTPFWDWAYTAQVPEGGTRDWSHSNAVEIDTVRDLVLVSARHLDWIIALDPASDAVAWRLGVDGDFTLDSGSWFSHPHAPEVQADGSILLYDNGNFRPGTGLEPGQEAPYSRAVEYSLDTGTMTATQSWEYVADPPRYAAFVGDADQLESGNVLVTDGGLQTDITKLIIDPTNVKYAILEEVERGSGQPVFAVQVGDPDGTESYTVYRADRVTAPAGGQIN